MRGFVRIGLGSDHAGFELCQILAERACEMGHETERFGAPSTEPFDYPLASDELARAIVAKQITFGVLVCGTGIGVSIRANRHVHVRAAVCCSVETARLARQHNHANVLCLGARTTDPELALQILETFLETDEVHAERHNRRVQQMDDDVST